MKRLLLLPLVCLHLAAGDVSASETAASQPTPFAAIPQAATTGAATTRAATTPAATSVTTTSVATTARSSRPAPLDEIAALLEKLDAPSADVREKAYRALLGLGREDLPALRSAARAAAPLRPGTFAALKPVVIHIFLSGQAYPSTADGALGIQMAPIVLQPLSGVDGPEAATLQSAVLISACKPGLAGYRYVEPGDIILSIRGIPVTALDQRFSLMIKSSGAGARVPMKIVRRGKVVEVAVTLSRRPLSLDQNVGDILDAAWLEPAEEYWNTQFAPALIETGSPPRPAASDAIP